LNTTLWQKIQEPFSFCSISKYFWLRFKNVWEGMGLW
jgi:hypothetical protein